MKRSIINRNIEWAIEVCKRKGIHLPSFAYWTPKEWEEKGDSVAFLKKVAMGWDVTDYDSNDFDRVGCVLFTVRNGDITHPEMGMVYCEKFLIMKEGQLLPTHFHYFKTEDIINRSGGILRVYVWNSTPDFDGYKKDLKGDVYVLCDGEPVCINAGSYIDIAPGNSITIPPYLYHCFEAVKGEGDLIVGEVSRVNNDSADNHFNPYIEFKKIEEDEPARYQLCGGYKQ